ncbi:hypothetical protein [Paenarthrobacter sp. YIM B13468]|uniref:hypothetical protein n=1 Tax=Paenarthrobacter sp. YIM B13468 TaxID=3366295 RepID=UPI00366C7A78
MTNTQEARFLPPAYPRNEFVHLMKSPGEPQHTKVLLDEARIQVQEQLREHEFVEVEPTNLNGEDVGDNTRWTAVFQVNVRTNEPESL